MSAKNHIEINKHTRLKNHFEQFRGFCKILTDGYILVDNDINLVNCNQEFARMLNSKKKALIKSGDLSSFFRTYIGYKEIAFKNLIGPEKLNRVDQVTLCVGQNKLLVIVSFFPLVEDGVCLGYIVLFRNMTDESILQFKYKDKYLEAMLDPLTGLTNRSYFMKELDKLFENIQKPGSFKTSSIILLDLDFFKNINDTYGHQVGDQTLIKVAEIIRGCVFSADVVGRYGGEEFIIVLPEVPQENAFTISERIRKKIESTMIHYDEISLNVTASCGVSSVTGKNDTVKLLLNRADKALYLAKGDGRNQTKVC